MLSYTSLQYPRVLALLFGTYPKVLCSLQNTCYSHQQVSGQNFLKEYHLHLIKIPPHSHGFDCMHAMYVCMYVCTYSLCKYAYYGCVCACVMKYSPTRWSLTNSTIDDILQLVHALLPKPNICLKTAYSLKRWWCHWHLISKLAITYIAPFATCQSLILTSVIIVRSTLPILWLQTWRNS